MDHEQQRQPGRPSILTDPEGYMRDFRQRMAAMSGQADQMRERMAEATARAESDEGEVAVTVNVGGALAGIEFAPSARHISGPTLAEMVMETYRRAAAEASEKAVEAMSDLFGSDSETARFVRQSVEQRLPREE
ncbi:YbaB/EbfC family nucleoid-associated protein [Glycomyces tarimensis]